MTSMGKLLLPKINDSNPKQMPAKIKAHIKIPHKSENNNTKKQLDRSIKVS